LTDLVAPVSLMNRLRLTATLPATAFSALATCSWIPPRTVMEIAGHATLEMTMNIYAHVTLDDKRSAPDQLGELLDLEDQDGDKDAE
jgi:integrase